MPSSASDALLDAYLSAPSFTERLALEFALVDRYLEEGRYARRADATRYVRGLWDQRQNEARDEHEGVYRVADRPEPPHQVYVGYSDDIERRLEQHASAGFKHRLPLLSTERRGRGREVLETLCNMKALGITNVRGAHHLRFRYLNEKRAAFREICQEFRLCFHCGQTGHVAPNCDRPAFSAWDSGF
jgi:hypothetical protein